MSTKARSKINPPAGKGKAGKPAKPEKRGKDGKQPPVPPIPLDDLPIDPEAKEDLELAVQQFLSLGDEVAAMEKRREKLRTEVIGPIFEGLGKRAIQGELEVEDPDDEDAILGFKIEPTKGRRQLSKESLLQNGVAMKVIEASYVAGKPGFKISRVGPAGNPDSGDSED